MLIWCFFEHNQREERRGLKEAKEILLELSLINPLCFGIEILLKKS